MKSKMLICLVIIVTATLAGAQSRETVTYQGELNVGKQRSAIYYLGSETGDLAAFCFFNASRVGRKILATCRKGSKCEFKGIVDWAQSCKLPGELSASATIISIQSVRRSSR